MMSPCTRMLSNKKQKKTGGGGIERTNQSLRAHEQVLKDQSYRFNESKKDIFDNEFEIKTVDMSQDPAAFSAELGRALEEIGFAIISGHGVPPAVFEACEVATHQVFERPEAQKQKFSASRPRESSVNQGYFAHKKTAEVQPDLVEGWVFTRRAFPAAALAQGCSLADAGADSAGGGGGCGGGGGGGGSGGGNGSSIFSSDGGGGGGGASTPTRTASAASPSPRSAAHSAQYWPSGAGGEGGGGEGGGGEGCLPAQRALAAYVGCMQPLALPLAQAMLQHLGIPREDALRRGLEAQLAPEALRWVKGEG
jgi:hypothetical protein